VLLLTGLGIQACTGSQESQARRLVEDRQSWEATRRLTTDLRVRQSLPSIYTRQTLEAIDEELEKARRRAEKPPS
jgi:hypothetical protein